MFVVYVLGVFNSRSHDERRVDVEQILDRYMKPRSSLVRSGRVVKLADSVV